MIAESYSVQIVFYFNW